MQTRLSEIINLTPIDVVVADYSVDEYFEHCDELFKIGLPFKVRSFTGENDSDKLLKRIVEFYGNQSLKARHKATPDQYANNRKYSEISLKDYVSEIFYSTQLQSIYAAKNFADDNILRVIGVPHPCEGLAGKFRSPNLWIGPKGSNTPLHKDSTDNFSIQIVGAKRWILFSVRDIEKLGLQKTRYGNYKPAGYDFQTSLRDIDILSKEVSCSDVIVEAGDLFYLPYGWSHYVENLSGTVMINYWLKPENYVPFILY